jgi:hypothetical protein
MKKPARLAAFILALGLAAPGLAAACGGNGQVPCTTSPAAFQRSTSCDGGSFYDPRNGGECWSCDGWTRSAAAVNASNGCYVPAGTSYKAASRVKNTAWAWDCGSGTFWDGWDKGACWSCGGWTRTASAVYTGSACSQGYGEQDRPGRYVKPSHCVSGEFSDPRNGGECWTCPSGYNRTASAVTASDACVAQTRCASNSIEYGGACWTKNDCGAKDGRPCTVVERIPSCNKDLYENRGRCVPLPPGESAFLAGLSAAAKNVSQDGMKACENAFAALPKLNTGSPFLDGETACNKAQMTGFLCATTQLPGQVGGAAALVNKVAVEWGRAPCNAQAVPVRAMCSTAMAMGRDLGDAFQCLTEAAGQANLSSVDPIALCRVEGELAFTAALMMAGGAVAEEGEAAEGAAAAEGTVASQTAQESGLVMKIARALVKANDAVGKANDANEVADKIRSIASCKRMMGAAGQGAQAAAAERKAGLPTSNVAATAASGDLTMSRINAAGDWTMLGKKIGNAWGNVPTIIAASGGNVYTVNAAGDLSIYFYDQNGNYQSTRKIGVGWGGGQTVLSAYKNALYLLKTDGTLWLYQHDAAGNWTSQKQIGNGWGGFAKVLSGGDGILYAIAANGDLMYYGYDGIRWTVAGRKIGSGWGAPLVLAGGAGDLYLVDSADILYRYHHRNDGEWVVTGQRVGNGWMAKYGTKLFASPDGSGDIYGVVR